jgi:hypothetical protein
MLRTPKFVEHGIKQTRIDDFIGDAAMANSARDTANYFFRGASWMSCH